MDVVHGQPGLFGLGIGAEQRRDRALATVRIVSISCANRALVSSSECSELSRSFNGLMTFTAASTGCADSSSSVR
ncbi:hypothetical protein ACFSKR_05915 [Kitasatospora cinereorecta]